MERMDSAKLNRLYKQSEEVDRSHFSEMRSNILLSAGDHYTKRTGDSTVRLRETSSNPSKKLRITKNHIYRVVKTYANSIISRVPGVTPTPKNELEMQDQKDAELNKAVWIDIKERHKLRQKFADYAHEFCEVGEHAVKISWDPNIGEIVGYAPLLDETGEPVMEQVGEQQVGVDEMGAPIVEPIMEMVPDEETPKYSGDFVFETIHGFNLLRDPAAENMDDSPYLTHRKMVDKKDLQMKYAEDDVKSKFFEGGKDETYIIFDSNKGTYEKTKDKVLVKETFFRPCMQYPKGYFYIFTDQGILEEGELPKALFPIRWVGFDKYPTSCRARSIVKIARPYQAEINRASSMEATHQVTMGDDKIIYQTGTTMAQGALLPGVRGIKINGKEPTILPGRSGSQYTEYIEAQKRELYQAVMLDEVTVDKSVGQDPYAMLFASSKQKAVFQPYVQKFESYLVEICELTLELAKYYLPDEALIAAVGRAEQVNIEEFRKTTKLCYQINVEPVSDDAETMLGKQVTFQHLLQYVGKQLDPGSIGKIMKNMPFMNNEESFSELTIDEDNVKNDMLLIERGGKPEIGQYDDNKYYIKKLTHRMKQADFDYLSDEVKNEYRTFLNMHQEAEARKVAAIQSAKDGMIPVGGALVTCQLRVPDPEDPTTSKQVRLPYEAIMDLIKKLEAQGKTLNELENINQGALEQMANQMGAMEQPQPQPMNPNVMMPPTNQY